MKTVYLAKLAGKDELQNNKTMLADCKALAQIKLPTPVWPAKAAHASNCSVPTKQSSRDTAATLALIQER